VDALITIAVIVSPAGEYIRSASQAPCKRAIVQGLWKRLGTSALPAFASALMPKCPFCWMPILSTLGLGSVINAKWLQPFALLLLALAAGSLAIRAWRTQSYSPLILGTSAAVAIFVFKFVEDLAAGANLSGAVLIAASLWIPRPRQTPGEKAAQVADCPCGLTKATDSFKIQTR
jgi:hypothetical protein